LLAPPEPSIRAHCIAATHGVPEAAHASGNDGLARTFTEPDRRSAPATAVTSTIRSAAIAASTDWITKRCEMARYRSGVEDRGGVSAVRRSELTQIRLEVEIACGQSRRDEPAG